MMIIYEQIPSNLRVPGQYNEISNRLAISSGAGVKNILIFAHKLPIGTALENKEYQINSLSEAGTLFGKGSLAHDMVAKFKALNKSQSLYCVIVPEGASTFAEWSVSLVGSSASDTAIKLSIAGKTTSVAISIGDTATQVATKIANAVASDAELLVDAGVDDVNTSMVVFVAKNAGTFANDITISIEPIDGITMTDTFTPATGEPDLSDTISKLNKGFYYHYFINPFTDTENMKALEAELDSRYSAMRQLGSRAFIGKASSDITSLKSYGAARNNPHVCCIGLLGNLSAQMPHIWATTLCATIAPMLASDPSQGLSSKLLTGLLATNHIDAESRNSLLYSGITTWFISGDGSIYLERPITMYQHTPEGEADSSYLDIQIPETLDAMRNYRNAEIDKTFKNFKLASDGDTFAPGTLIVTPKTFRSFLLDLYRRIFVEQRAWATDYDSYKATLLVEIDPDSKTRLNYSDQPTLTGQFYIAAGKTEFR